MQDERQNDNNSFNTGIFPLKHLRVLSYASLLLAICLIAFILIKPYYLEIANVKIAICILLALLFSIFFFILWPHNATIEKTVLQNLAVRLAGPLVLWIILVFIFNKILSPDKNTMRFFEIKPTGNVSHLPFLENPNTIEDSAEEIESYYFVQDKNILKGILVEFKPGVSAVKTKVTMGNLLRFDALFDRQKKFATISNLDTLSQ